jgi:non-specific serine/threonine protein kinase
MKKDWSKTLQQFVMPLAKEYKVDFDRSIVQEIKDGDPELKLFLLEKGDYLVFQPSFNYKGYETKVKDRDEVVVPQGDKVMIVHRNRQPKGIS